MLIWVHRTTASPKAIFIPTPLKASKLQNNKNIYLHKPSPVTLSTCHHSRNSDHLLLESGNCSGHFPVVDKHLHSYPSNRHAPPLSLFFSVVVCCVVTAPIAAVFHPHRSSSPPPTYTHTFHITSYCSASYKKTLSAQSFCNKFC
ncbi:hypothetical protein QVD17_31274 [Tagetes erecta]|uniref:Uncharacterized protein n=1 Tax=Tagetes erecta TaxID=13708 RepID=A0AAD8K3F3_TARER|nr:hypothetical protein QVD17_31274 [Tagetes erecta]